MEYSKGKINSFALQILDKQYNFEVWLQSNVRAVKGQTFKGRRGVSDIIGYSRENGRFVLCEVKTLNDSFSHDQVKLLTDLHNSGGFSFVAYQDKLSIQVKPFIQVREQFKIKK